MDPSELIDRNTTILAQAVGEHVESQVRPLQKATIVLAVGLFLVSVAFGLAIAWLTDRVKTLEKQMKVVQVETEQANVCLQDHIHATKDP